MRSPCASRTPPQSFGPVGRDSPERGCGDFIRCWPDPKDPSTVAGEFAAGYPARSEQCVGNFLLVQSGRRVNAPIEPPLVCSDVRLHSRFASIRFSVAGAVMVLSF